MLSALGASAQTAIVNNFKNFGVIPGYLTQDGMAVGYSIDFGVDYSEGSALAAPGEVTIVDNDFKAQKSFTLNRRQVGYNYKKETFEAQPQVEANVYSSGDYYYFWEEKLRDGGTITLEEFVNHGYGEVYTDFEGYTCKGGYIFFFEELFGKKYPLGEWYRYVNGRVYRCWAYYNDDHRENSYKIKFPTKGEIYEDPRYEDYGDFDFTDYNQGVQNKYNLLSQALFNNDSKWEYLVGEYGTPTEGNTYEYGMKSNGEYYYNEEKGVFYAWREEYLHYNRTAWQVRNEDGDVVMTFKPVHENCVDFDFDEDIFVFGDYVYLSFEEAVEDGVDEYGDTKYVWYDTLYRIDKQHNSAEMVKSVKADGRFASAHDGMVNVSIDAADSGSDVILSNAAGQVVGREHIRQGETTAALRTGRLQHGVYNVSLRRDGRIIKNEKLMIK